ncbi:HAD family hydrolase [soil metagenome]
MMNQRLLLFDIDGTLLDTGGAGGSALLDAAEEVLEVRREDLPPLDLAGATDGAVIRKLFADAGRPLEDNKAEAFRVSYLGHLQRRLHHEDSPGKLLPGVTTLLSQLATDERFSIGLLTGNLRHGATLKLERFGIMSHFLDGGFGEDGEHRNLLGPVAVNRMEIASRRKFHPEQVIVIGDTPKDIACAHAMGARCLAVATGKFDRASLHPHQAWALLDDLSEVEQVKALFSRQD